MTPRTSTRRRTRPRLETLEGRALLTAGTLDPTFGGSGTVLTPAPLSGGFGPYVATASYPQSDPADAGKVVIAAEYNTGTKDDFAVYRLNPDGSPDTSFGGTGMVLTSFNSLDNAPHAVAIQPDGKIVVGGCVEVTGYPNYESIFGLARYNTNGTLDTSFGKGGLVMTQFSLPKHYVPYDGIWSLAIEPNGEILAGGDGDGVTQFGGNPIQAFTVALYHANGQLDTSFGSGGVAYTTLNATTSAYSLYDVGLQAVNGATKIVAVGRSRAPGGSGWVAMVARYNLNGVLDTTFGTGGVASFPNIVTQAGAIQPDGSILAAGYVESTYVVNGKLYSEDHMSVVRFTPGGAVDTSFGQGGQVQTAFVSGDDVSQAAAVTVQPDGAIIVGGLANQLGTPGNSGNPSEPALARYTTTGQLDTTFGAAGSGLVITPVDSSTSDYGQYTSLALRADGTLVTAGYAQVGGSSDILTSRYLGDPAATTTALTSSLNPANGGDAVTFTATITTAGPIAPTGTVEFFDGTTLIGTGTIVLLDGVATATFTTSTLAAGTHAITALYEGDADNLGSTSTALSQVVNA